MAEDLRRDYVDHENPKWESTSNRSKHVPEGFETYKWVKKYWYQCLFEDENGIRCSVHISQEKWSKILGNPIKMREVIDHEHSFPDIERYFAHPIPDHNNELIVEGPRLTVLNQKIVVFLGKHNLPIGLANSEIFRDILIECCLMGQENPSRYAPGLIQIPSRPTLTKGLIDLASKLNSAAIQQYAANEYVCLAMDSGKVGQFTYLVIYLTNANMEEHPRVLRTRKYFSGDLEDYENEIILAIRECMNLKLVPVGFVGDNLRVQWKAFSEINERFNTIAIPCGCHTLNLALSDARNSNEQFAHYCFVVETIAHLFNRKPIKALFLLSCPLPVETRWVILFDVALWIVCHSQDFLDFLENEEIDSIEPLKKYIPMIVECIFEAAPKLVIWLLPMKLLMNRFERDRTSVVDIYPFTKSSMFTLEEIVDNDQELLPVANTIISCVNNRLVCTEAGALQYGLFLMTIAGFKVKRAIRSDNSLLMKQIIQESYPLVYTSFIDTLTKARGILSTQKIGDAEKDAVIQQLDIRFPETFGVELTINPQGEEESEEWDAVPVEIEPTVLSTAAPLTENVSDNDPDIDEHQENLNELNDVYFPNQELAEDVLQEANYMGLKALGKFIDLACKMRGLIRNEVSSLLNEYFNDNEILEEVNKNSNNYDFWTSLLETKYEQLIRTILIYSVMVASEAVCERVFSQMRKYLTEERSRTGPKLQEGRNSFMDTTVEQIYERLGLILRK